MPNFVSSRFRRKVREKGCQNFFVFYIIKIIDNFTVLHNVVFYVHLFMNYQLWLTLGVEIFEYKMDLVELGTNSCSEYFLVSFNYYVIISTLLS